MTAHAQAMPLHSAAAGAGRLIAQTRRFPMLEPQEEFMLAKRWREHGDRDAAHRLVTSHLRLVAKIALGYRGYGLPIAEVISEGNVGLMQAVKRFDPDRGFRLTTYAMWWIRASSAAFTYRQLGVKIVDGHSFGTLPLIGGKSDAVPSGNPQVPDAGARARVHARQALEGT